MKPYVVITCVIGLAGCANNLWIHPSKNNAQFNQDKNDCIVQASNAIPREIVPQQPPPPPSYTTNCYGAPGTASCTTTPKYQPNPSSIAQSIADGNTNRARENFFSSCMQSKGWTLHSAETIATIQAQNNDRIEQYKSAMESLTYEAKQTCADPAYAAYFAKTSCSPSDLTLIQLSDSSRATKKEKEAISAVDSVFAKITRERSEAALKYMTPPAFGSDVSALEIKAGKEFEKLRLDLYSGKLTWGQFNTERKRLSSQLHEEYNSILKKFNL